MITLNKNYVYTPTDNFSLKDTLECGQCFRWDIQPDQSFVGVVGNKVKRISQNGKEVIFHNTTPQEFENFWCEYFDFNTNYNQIRKNLTADDIMKTASTLCDGIHILKQDPWETLCSFIISQNNNIPRIKGIVSRLCENFGEHIENGYYSFPSFEIIANQTVESLAPLRSGFRAKYILDAAKKLSSGKVDINRIKEADFENAKNELMSILGVGNKVADCALLYGFYRLEAFPEDVWIKRAMNEFYPNGLPTQYKQYAGIAQQYLFHYIRNFWR
jgi:N-glycosylase/DNA lyase